MFWCARTIARSGAPACLKNQSLLNVHRLSVSRLAYTSSSSSSSSNGGNKNNNLGDSIKSAAAAGATGSGDGQFGSTEKIKKLLHIFEQKIQNEHDERRGQGDRRHGGASLSGDNNEYEDDGYEYNEDGTVKPTETEEDAQLRDEVEQMMVQEDFDDPYALDPKMMRQFNRYQKVAIPADSVDFDRNHELVEIFVGEDEDAEAIDKELAANPDEEGDEEEVIDEGELSREIDSEIEAEKRRVMAALKSGQPIDPKTFPIFGERNQLLPEDATPEQIETHLKTIRYLKQFGIDTTQFTPDELAFMAHMSPDELYEAAENANDGLELAELEDAHFVPPLHEIDEETGEVKEEINPNYILYKRDNFEFQLDMDEHQKQALEAGERERKEASEQDGPNTLYDDMQTGDDLFLIDDMQEYNPEEIKELSEALDAEPLFSYENDKYLDGMEELDTDDFDLSEDAAKKSDLRVILDPLKHVTPGLLEHMTAEQQQRLMDSLKLDKLDSLTKEQFQQKVHELVEVDPKFARSLVGGEEKVPLEGTDEELEEIFEQELAHEPEDDVYDETGLFELDERGQQTIVDGSEGLVQFQDFVDKIDTNEQLYDTDWYHHLRVLGMEADMYLRRNKKKMVVLAKRRERAAKYREATIKKNLANPIKREYKRQELPSGEYVFKSTHAPTTFVRVQPFTEEEVSAENTNKYKHTLAQSYNTLSANGYYSRRDTKKSMEIIRRALASYKPHMNSRRLQLESAEITKDPRFEKQKALLIEPWMLPRYNPEYYAGEDMTETGSQL